VTGIDVLVSDLAGVILKLFFASIPLAVLLYLIWAFLQIL
jgi:hypothetical protein